MHTGAFSPHRSPLGLFEHFPICVRAISCFGHSANMTLPVFSLYHVSQLTDRTFLDVFSSSKLTSPRACGTQNLYISSDRYRRSTTGLRTLHGETDTDSEPLFAWRCGAWIVHQRETTFEVLKEQIFVYVSSLLAANFDRNLVLCSHIVGMSVWERAVLRVCKLPKRVRRYALFMDGARLKRLGEGIVIMLHRGPLLTTWPG